MKQEGQVFLFQKLKGKITKEEENKNETKRPVPFVSKRKE